MADELIERLAKALDCHPAYVVETVEQYRGWLCQKEDELSKLKLQIGELRKALDRDKTGLAAALAGIREEVKGRRWICEGRGSYQYDDDRYREETGHALDAIEKIAADALAASGKLAHEALTDKRKHQEPESDGPDCPQPIGNCGKCHGPVYYSQGFCGRCEPGKV